MRARSYRQPWPRSQPVAEPVAAVYSANALARLSRTTVILIRPG